LESRAAFEADIAREAMVEERELNYRRCKKLLY